jgi:hypothetical protein
MKDVLTPKEVLQLVRVLMDCRRLNLEAKGIHTAECLAAQEQLKAVSP